MIARVLSPLEQITMGGRTGHQPLIFSAMDSLPAAGGYVDVTNQPTSNMIPDPNLLTVEVHNVTQDWLDAIALDNRFEVLYVE